MKKKMINDLVRPQREMLRDLVSFMTSQEQCAYSDEDIRKLFQVDIKTIRGVKKHCTLGTYNKK